MENEHVYKTIEDLKECRKCFTEDSKDYKDMTTALEVLITLFLPFNDIEKNLSKLKLSK